MLLTLKIDILNCTCLKRSHCTGAAEDITPASVIARQSLPEISVIFAAETGNRELQISAGINVLNQCVDICFHPFSHVFYHLNVYRINVNTL